MAFGKRGSGERTWQSSPDKSVKAIAKSTERTDGKIMVKPQMNGKK